MKLVRGISFVTALGMVCGSSRYCLLALFNDIPRVPAATASRLWVGCTESKYDFVHINPFPSPLLSSIYNAAVRAGIRF
jgi:hypothetical protein